MRATVNITAQAEAVSCSAKTTGVEQDCQFTGSSITPFFTQTEKIEVVVKCNSVDVTSKITLIDIDLSVNQVGICTLNSPNVSNFKVNDIIEVEFTITDYGNVKVFYGYIDRIEKNHLNQGQIVCADILRDLRDGVLTQIISEFSEVDRGNYIGATFSTQSILPYLLGDYSINTILKDTHREFSFANANKLQILQQLADEYCLVFWVDYQNNKVVFKTVDTSETFNLPLEHSFTITDRAKANSGIKVIYEYQYEKIPEQKIEIVNFSTGEFRQYNYSIFLGGLLVYEYEVVYPKNSIFFSSKNVTICRYSRYSLYRETITYDGSSLIFWKNKTTERIFLDSEYYYSYHKIVTYEDSSIFWKTRTIIKYNRYNKTKTTKYYEDGITNLVSSAVEMAEPPQVSIPTSEITTDEKSVLIGSEENPIFINTSYISYEDEAKALADWKVKTELQSKDIDIEIKKIIPGLKAGEYVTSDDFEGSCFIETVNYQYNVQNRNCSTRISGVLIDA